MGAFTDKIRNEFTKSTRQRGMDYYVTGVVKNLTVDSTGRINSQVYGRERYDVSIDIERDPRSWLLLVQCSCPYKDSHNRFCKHLWATLLQFEFDGHLNKLGSVPAIVIVVFADDNPVSWKDDQDEVQEDADLEKFGSYVISTIDFAKGRPRPVLIPTKSARATNRNKKPDPPPEWLRLLQFVPHGSFNFRVNESRSTPVEPAYILEVMECAINNQLVISLAQRKTNAKGTVTGFKKLALRAAEISHLPNPVDRSICMMLLGAGQPGSGYGYYDRYSSRSTGESHWKIAPELHNEILPLLFGTGRLFARRDRGSEPTALVMDEGPPWELVLHIGPSVKADQFVLEGRVRRGAETVAIAEMNCFVVGAPGLFFRRGVLSRLDFHGCDRWMNGLKNHGALPIQREHALRFLTELNALRVFPPIVWPTDWNIDEVNDVAPVPELSLQISEKSNSYARDPNAAADVTFRYGETAIDGKTNGSLVADAKTNQFIRRHIATEQRLRERLFELGVKADVYSDALKVPVKRIPHMVTTLLAEGWKVLGNQKPYRQAGDFKFNVSSGIDWFELDGHVDFGGQSLPLPEILAAARKGERFILLGDGSLGMLPEQWLAKNRAWLDMGKSEDGRVRFAKTQLGLIDALLAEMPDATFDTQLAEARKKLNAFAGIQPRGEPDGFTGQLRDYQRDGLGWLHFLQEFGWGGCLADDMGLGKTVQLLAFLADMKRQQDRAPALVIAPKSLMFNWAREAQRFTPDLRVLTYTGLERRKLHEELLTADLVLTTYGTLRRDIETLRDRQFSYVVLDEAQAIKNPDSQNAKATRLLRADHRLVLTGTPVENHLGDLWSLFEFLNPGMLGTVPAFKNSFGGTHAPGESPTNVAMLQRILRPFILRRTKDQVARELPPRSEQTIVCEMGAKQLAYYRQIRDHYRATLLVRVDEKGLAKSKIHVLEALLRLRQAACHPGLIDKARKDEEATKLESLFAMIGEFVEKGHKALVFSQFTSLLAIVRAELDKRGIVHEYLDGRTRKREQCVDRFQTDAACPLFLISLKAGGVGLNLTAADYVFILDPWWNPAVEAQAIDRTHRIGQQKKVIAYRLIARDTVEEKILELQKSKRALANAIIAEQNSLISDLSRDDLALLLS